MGVGGDVGVLGGIMGAPQRYGVTAPRPPPLKDPEGKPKKASIRDNGDGTYTVSYVPDTTGRYTILIKYGGDEIPYSPYRIRAVPAGDASKCTVTGGCPPRGEIGGVPGGPLGVSLECRVGAARGRCDFRGGLGVSLQRRMAASRGRCDLWGWCRIWGWVLLQWRVAAGRGRCAPYRRCSCNRLPPGGAALRRL